LRSSFVSEAFSPLIGERALLVDLRAAGAVDALELQAAELWLRQLPCPSIAWIDPDLSGPLRAWSASFDLVVTGEDELAPVLETIRGWPIASLALVQLLRHGRTLDLHEALVAESLVYSMLQAGPEFAAWRSARREARQRTAPLAPAVLCERNDDTLEITLNRPQKHNAFSSEMRDGLCEALHTALADPAIERVVLRGAGASFCSGGDLDEFGSFPDPATAHVIRSTRNPGRLLAALAERVRFDVHGACVGAGIELPAFARRVVAAPSAFFQLPEVRMGLVPGAGGTASLPRRIGRQRCAWLALSAQRIDARTALGWGLVDELAPETEGAARRYVSNR